MRAWVFLAGLMIAPMLRAQSGAVALLVIDDATDAALADVRVTIVGRVEEGVTDARGRFIYTAPRAGKVVLIVRRLGYNPGTVTVDVASGDTSRVTFAMTAAPQALARVNVRDTLTSASPFLAGFEHRASVRAGSSSFITRGEIDRRKPGQVTDLLRRVNSISVVDSLGVLMAASRRLQKPVQRGGPAGGFLDLANCVLRVAVDGQLKEWGFAVNTIPPEQVHGIEIYPGPATIPAEFASMSRDANCGLLMIWTRRDQ